MQAGDLERTFCSLLAGWMSYERLHYSSDRTDMLAPDQPVQLGWRAFHREFGPSMDYVVSARGSRPEAQDAIEEVAAQIGRQPAHFEQLLYRLDLPGLATARPWLKHLSQPDQALPALKAFLAQKNKPKLVGQLTELMPLLTRLLEALVVSLESRGEAVYQSPFNRNRPRTLQTPPQEPPRLAPNPWAMRWKLALLTWAMTGVALAVPPEIDRLLKLPQRPLAERQIQSQLAGQLKPEREGWLYLALYDLRPEAPQALEWIDRVEQLWKGRRDSGWFAVRRRRLRCLFEQQYADVSGLIAELDQLLPQQPQGPERAGYFATRARIDLVRNQQEEGRKNLEAAIAEPGLSPSQRLSYRVSLASNLLNQDDLDAFEALWEEIVKELPADLDESALLGLVQVELGYARRKGVVWSSHADYRLRARRAGLHFDRGRQLEALTSLVYAYKQGQPEKAEQAWQEARGLLGQMTRTEESVPSSLLLLGSAPSRASADWAWTNYLGQLKRARLPISLHRAWALRALRVSLGGQLATEKLAGFARILADQAHRQGDWEMEIETRNWLVQLLQVQKLRDTAALEQEQRICLQLRLRLPERATLAWGCDQASLAISLADTYESQQKSAAALELLWQSLERNPAANQACQLLERIVSISRRQGATEQLERALEMYSARLAQLPPDQAAQRRATMLELAGSSLGERRQQWLSQLRLYYQQKLQSQAVSGERFETCARLAGVLKQLGDLAGARAVCEEALTQTQGRGDWRLDRVRYVYLDLLRQLRDQTSLLARGEQWLTDPKTPRWVRTQVYSQILRLLADTKQYQQQLDWIERSEKDSQAGSQDSTYYKADALVGLHRGEEALAIFRAALPKAQGAERIRNLLRQGTMLHQMKRPEEAIQSQREAFELSLKDDSSSLAAEAALSLSVTLMNSGEEWRSVALRALQHLQTGKLEPVSRTSRATLILVVAQGLQNFGRLDEAEAWLREHPLPAPPPDYIASVVARLRAAPQLAALLPSEASPTTQEPVGALLDRLRLAYPELGNLLTLRSSNLESLRTHLKPDQVLLAYYPTGEGLWLVGLGRQGAFSRQVVLTPERLQELCRKGPDPESLRALNDLLIEPVHEQLASASQLLIVPTGALWKVPFQALQDQQGRCLSQRWSASQLTSGDLLRLADGQWRELPRGRRVMLGAPPAAQLPGAEVELRRISRLLPGSELRLGAEAKSSVLLAGEPIALLHLATHAQFVPGAPMQSGLMLQDGTFNLSQLHRLRLQPGAMVVLSCCEGGMGNDTPGAEPVSLAGSLSAAGASTLVANLWKVDDEAALVFFTDFYASLAREESVHQAFRTGQQACRRSFPQPRDWGGFCLIGDPR